MLHRCPMMRQESGPRLFFAQGKAMHVQGVMYQRNSHVGSCMVNFVLTFGATSTPPPSPFLLFFREGAASIMSLAFESEVVVMPIPFKAPN